MRSRLLPFLLFSIVASILPGALADSVLLKNGTEIKGEIISDGPEGVLIEYYATATIKDQKCFKKEEVAKVVTVAEDERGLRRTQQHQGPGYCSGHLLLRFLGRQKNTRLYQGIPLFESPCLPA